MEADFEPALIELTRQNAICLRTLVILIALLYVDRLWEQTKLVLKGGIFPWVVVVGCLSFSGSTFAQPYTATMGGHSFTVVAPSQASLNPSSGPYRWTLQSGLVYGTFAERAGVVAVNDTAHASETWYAQYTLSLAPGVYEIFAQWGHPNGALSGYSPKRIGIAFGPFSGGQFVSPVVLRDTESDLVNANDGTFVFSNAGVSMGNVAMAKLGEVSVWSGNIYVAAQAAIGSHTNGDRFGAIAYRKVRDVPLWQKYIGGDVDTAGYFDDLKASDVVSAVCIPSGLVSTGSLDGDGSLAYGDDTLGTWAKPTIQSGVINRYVQVTFNDARYVSKDRMESATIGQPTMAWFITLGRNGGLTAYTVMSGMTSLGPPTRVVRVCDWYRSAGSGGVGDPWYYSVDGQQVLNWRRPRLDSGARVLDKNWAKSDYYRLARWPFEADEWYAGPVMQSSKVLGTGSLGVSDPSTSDARYLNPVITQYTGVGLPHDGVTSPVYSPVSVPSGYDITDEEILNNYFMVRYPLHVNHLRCVVEYLRANPPVGEPERRFVDLLDAWVRMCDGTFTPALYRAQISKGADDALTLEDDQSTSQEAAPDQATIRPSIPGTPSFGTPPDRSNPFNGAFPTGQTGMDFSLDLNAPMGWMGIAPSDGLVIHFNTDPLNMQDDFVIPGWQNAWGHVNTWRLWCRSLLLFGMTVWFFWDKVARVWSEL